MVNFWLQHDVTGHPAARCSVQTAHWSPYELISTTTPSAMGHSAGSSSSCFNEFWVFVSIFFLKKKKSLAQPGLVLKVAMLGRLNLDACSPQPVLPKCWSYRHYHLQLVFHCFLKKLPKEIGV